MITAKDLISKKNTISESKLATVTQISSGRPLITFDGEAQQSQMQYPYTAGQTFAVGDRVFMQAVGKKYIIAYKIIQ